MAYQVNWAPAKEDIHALESELRKRIIKKVGSITDNPFHFVERVQGYLLFKLRIGDYRAIIDIKQKDNEIVVVLVGHRSKVHQELARRMRS
jgi:mRNA-degrading endonuclease RelE of RelBE toxin-antitoxin system